MEEAVVAQPGRVASRSRARVASLLRSPVLVDAILPTIGIRVAIMFAALFVVIVFQPAAVPSKDPFLEIWNRWDAPHFFELARGGYGPPTDPARIVLFPLFPVLIAVGSLVAQPLFAAMAISFLATLAASVGVYRLARLDYSRGTARAAVVAMNLFPTAFAFVAPYSEAPFLAFAVWSLLAARSRDWRGAEILGMLASLTRLQGVFLFPGFLLEYWLIRRRLGRDVVWLGLVPVGLLVYLAINVAVFGDPLHFVAVQRTVFNVANEAPWDALPGLLGGVTSPKHDEFWATVYLAPFVTYLVMGAVALWTLWSWRRRPAEAVYSTLTFASLTTLSWPISLPRYILGLPAAFSGLAVLSRRIPGGVAFTALSTMLFTVFLTLFAIGHWAF